MLTVRPLEGRGALWLGRASQRDHSGNLKVLWLWGRATLSSAVSRCFQVFLTDAGMHQSLFF